MSLVSELWSSLFQCVRVEGPPCQLQPGTRPQLQQIRQLSHVDGDTLYHSESAHKQLSTDVWDIFKPEVFFLVYILYTAVVIFKPLRKATIYAKRKNKFIKANI